MALVIETGLIVAGADSYVSLADALAYHASRGNTAWANSTDALREPALRKAADYLDMYYFSRWKGVQVQPSTQPLQWPRYNVNLMEGEVSLQQGKTVFGNYLSPTVIPQRIKDAQCELALRALSGSLSPDLPRGGKVSSITVGPISKSFEAGAPGRTSYVMIDQMLAQFITSKNSNLVRS